MRLALLLVLAGIRLAAQDPRPITLDEAERIAIAGHPRIAAARLNAEASGMQVRQVKAAFQPLLSGNLTSVGAERNTAIAAGNLQTSGLASRAASGLGVSQLLLDFGRTSSLADSARLRSSALDRGADSTRAQILLRVDQAYFRLLALQEVLQVAKARLEMQRLTLRQVEALAASSLKSTLDVSFAQVAVSEAEMALFQAQNDADAGHALLAAALGETQNERFAPSDVPLPAPPVSSPEELVREGLQGRPDLASSQLSVTAAQRFADAEKKLKYPSISAVAAVGVSPFHQTSFADRYSGAGLNVSIPFLNGGLYASRKAEAELRARGAEKDAQAVAVQVAAEVRTAWYDARTAWQRIDLTARIADQAATTLRLAKARYDLGLSGILELTQSQLALTTAQINSANAKYDYLIRTANLKYATGALR